MDDLRSALDSALRVFASALGAQLEALGHANPAGWEQLCASEAGAETSRFNFRDPQALLNLIRKPNRIANRMAVSTTVAQQANKVRHIRNRLYHHEHRDLTPEHVLVDVSAIANLARSLGLAETAAELEALWRAVRDLDPDAVTDSPPANIGHLEAALSEAHREAERRAAAEAELLELRDDLEANLIAARSSIAEITQARAEDAAQIAELTAALSQLNAQIQFERREMDVAVAVEHLRQVALERAQMVAAQPGTEAIDQIRADDGYEAPHGSAAVKSGDPWPFERGSYQLRLSRANRDLIDDEGVSMRTRLAADLVSSAVEDFLLIRPGGGRVWMDEDGDVTSFKDGRLVYLGRLPLSSRASGSGASESSTTARAPGSGLTSVTPADAPSRPLDIADVLRQMELLRPPSERS